MAQQLIDLMPPHLHYVEPYFGGGQVLLAKDPEGVSEVANDIDGRLMTFWKVLRDETLFESFRRRVSMLPFADSVFEWAQNERDTPARDDRDAVEVAIRLFVRYRMSRQALGQDFATLSRNRTRRGMNEQVSQWLGAVEGLPAAHVRLQRVVVLNQDALEVIRQQDGENTLFYLDPPYVADTRVAGTYEYEVDEDHHRKLLTLIKTLRGKVMISGYHSEMYDRELGEWNLKEFKRAKNSSSARTKPVATECVWMNYGSGAR